MIGAAIRAAGAVILATAMAGCGTVRSVVPLPPQETTAERLAREEAEGAALAAAQRERAREAVSPAPDLAQPRTTAATRIWQRGLAARGLRIMVAIDARALWLMRDTLVLFRAPIAVGTEQPFTYAGRRYDFTTPIGERRVLGRDTMPLWVPPDWHYFEVAAERGLEVVNVRSGQRYVLADSTHIELRGSAVGRVNRFGNFWPFTPGAEIIFGDRIYVPPLGSRQRQVPAVLGTHKLVLGDGYLIHGTDREDSIGDAVSHGCVRMYNEDVARLYDLVPIGTPVYIF
ncbi:MAG TPA: L,D-transpeptidase [Longimicrobiales bacterium]|nr:L,D-transpeptidase [Longimicrobiales bacterium]